MFFFIGDEAPLQALHKVHDRLYLDDGWSSTVVSGEMVWFKGYSTDCTLSDDIAAVVSHGYRPAGKWCAIVSYGDDYEIMHPPLRGFPLYERDKFSRTNLKLEAYTPVCYDGPHINEQPALTLEQASTIIGDILVENTVNFLKYTKVNEMNVLCSAGLDTMTSWAILDSVTKDYTLHAYVPKQTDRTLHEHLGRIREYESDLLDKISQDYWGYDVMSAFKEPNWYLTGYYAETMQLRSGAVQKAVANYQGKHTLEILNETDYLYWFIKRPDIAKRHAGERLVFKDDMELKDYLHGTIFNDYQMWHIDDNMTFSPFADFRITQTSYRMSIADITANCKNGDVQRNIIKRFKPEFLSLVSDYKNSKDTWGNFRQNFKNITLDPQVRVKIR